MPVIPQERPRPLFLWSVIGVLNGPPPIDFAPILAHFYGLGAVPIWFVSWDDLQTAISDDLLTLDELQAMSSLRIGMATTYREVLHPTEAADVPSLTIEAQGVLTDGTSFQLRHHGSEGDGIDTRIQIGIRPAIQVNVTPCRERPGKP
jgi:hypothetical protein